MFNKRYTITNDRIPKKQVPYNIEARQLQRDISDIDTEIAKLTERRRVLKQKLIQAAKLPKSTKVSAIKPYSLYILRLQNDCWYIGYSRNPERMYTKHCKGKGAYWSGKHAPIELYKTIPTQHNDQSAAGLAADALTLQYAQQYGLDKVRGGGYCQAKPRWPEELSEPQPEPEYDHLRHIAHEQF